MAIDVVTKEGNFQITNENYADSMQKLESMIKPGTPVLLEKYNKYNFRKTADNILFFADSFVPWAKAFSIEKGKRNHIHAQFDKDMITYRLIASRPVLESHRVSQSDIEYTDHMQENMRGQQYTVTTSSESGLQSIVIGDQLKEKYADALNELRFASDAIYFQLHPAYSMQSSWIREVLNEPRNSIFPDPDKIACVRASINLLLSELQKGPTLLRDGEILASQLGWCKGGANKWQQDGHPVNDHDYIIHEIMYPYRSVAFVKVKNVSMHGDTYILPYDEKMETIVENAFSKENVMKYYPMGL